MSEHRKPLVWVTGAAGLIGSYLLRTAPAGAFEVQGLARIDLDLTQTAAVRERFQREKPSLVIHCAALSKSPVCQKQPALARKLNVETTELLADLLARSAQSAMLVFFSTDLVFDGKKGWYVESDPANPLTVYAETKIAAEQIVLRNPGNLVIRTALNGGNSPSGDRGFNEELRRGWQAGKPMRLFTDEFRCPIPAIETARAVWKLIQKGAHGVFHVAGKERLSRWQIGKLLAERWPQLQPKIEPGLLRDYAGAPRSPDTSLDCRKAEDLLGEPLPGLTEWLKNHPEEPF
jgi:dTDP-4-dehydrorhamnose reductase